MSVVELPEAAREAPGRERRRSRTGSAAPEPRELPPLTADPSDSAEILFELANAISRIGDPPAALMRLASLALRATAAERSVVFIHDPQARALVPVAADAAPAFADPARWRRYRGRALIPVGSSPSTKRLWDHAGPILVEDASRSTWIPGTWRAWGSRSAALVPLVTPDERLGLLAIDYVTHRHSFTAEEERLLGAIGSAATAVVSNARLHEAAQARLRRYDAMVKLSDVVIRSMNLRAGLTALNADICAEMGLRCERASLFDPKLAHLVGAPRCDPGERALVRRWRAEGGRASTGDDGTSLIPIPIRGRPAGVLCVRAERTDAEIDRGLLASVAAGIGEVVTKARLHQAALDRSRELAVAEERERVARDLHDAVGSMFHQIGGIAQEALLDGSDEDRLARLRSIAVDGAARVRDAVDALALLHMHRWGLLPALRFLAEHHARASGVATECRTLGRIRRLSRRAETLLFRVAYAALTSVERHSRATGIVMTLSFERKRVTIAIRDDGVDLEQRLGIDWRSTDQVAMRALARAMRDAGGHLELRRSEPRGLVIEASLPHPARPQTREAGHRSLTAQSEQAGARARQIARP